MKMGISDAIQEKAPTIIFWASLIKSDPLRTTFSKPKGRTSAPHSHDGTCPAFP
jgi:hypothetical protein